MVRRIVVLLGLPLFWVLEPKFTSCPCQFPKLSKFDAKNRIKSRKNDIGQRKRDDNKDNFFFFGGGAGRKTVQNAIFHGKRHDNIILKVNILLSRNFVVMAQAPNWDT